MVHAQGSGSPAGPAKPPAAGSGSSGSTTQPPQAPNATQNDPFGKNTAGVQGRLIPNPPTRVMVELYLDGARNDTAFTQSDGTFSFPRARVGFRYEIRVEVSPDTEFREEIEFMPGYPNMIQINNPQRLHPINGAKKTSGAGGVVSMANLMAPKKAVSEFEKGRDLGQKKKYDEGMEHLQKAVAIYEKYPDAYNEMGLIQKRQDHLKEASEMFSKAIEVDPKWTSPYMNLAQIQFSTKAYAEMLKTTQRVLDLDPNLGDAHFLQAVGLLNTNKLDAAEKEALLAERGEAKIAHAQIHLVLGNVYEMKGNSGDAVVRYRMYLKEAPEAPNSARLLSHINDLEHPDKLAKAANQ